MTKLEIINSLFDINEDVCDIIYNNDTNQLKTVIDNIFSSTLLHEDNFRLVLKAFRLANMPFSINGYNILPYNIRTSFWSSYKDFIRDLTIGIIDLHSFLNMYGKHIEIQTSLIMIFADGLMPGLIST